MNRPTQGMGLNYLVEFLQYLQVETRSAQLHRISPYKLKTATLRTIRWCLKKNLISRREEYKSSFKSRKKPQVFYKITDDGRQLLRLIS